MKLLFFILVPLYQRRKKIVFLALLLTLITGLAGIYLLGISGWLITSTAIISSIGIFNLFVPTALIRCLSFIRIISRYSERLISHTFILYLLKDLRCSVFQALTYLDPNQLIHYKNGDLVSRMISDIDTLDSVFLLLFSPLCVALILGIILTLVIAIWLPIASIILFIVLLLVCVFLPIVFLRSSKKHSLHIQENIANLRVSILDTIDGHTDLVLMQAISQIQEKFNFLSKEVEKIKTKQAKLVAKSQFCVTVIAGLSILAILWSSLDIFNFDKNIISSPILVGIILAVLGFFELIPSILEGSIRSGISIHAAARISEITNKPVSLPNVYFLKRIPEKGIITFSKVSFSYKSPLFNKMPSVLDSINLNINVGEHIAIIGPSGSGKSTLLHLLLRLEEPNTGSIIFGNYDIRYYSKEQLYRRISFLSQDAPVFQGTVRSNLLIGNPNASNKLLWNILEIVYLADFIKSLPKNLDTWIGETGANLSKGQSRRLCLARTLLSKATVLVLDEPTSGLDASTEFNFFSNLKRSVNGKTVILTTHSNLPTDSVKNIYNLEKGLLHHL